MGSLLGWRIMNDHDPRMKDMSWGGLLGTFGVILILAMVLIPVPDRGPDGRGIVPADCLTSLLGTFAIGIISVVVLMAVISYRRRGYYSTPRRDVAIASFVVFLALTYLWPFACVT